eukprot:107180-Pleurochrysis_carterae.AAC.3
MAFSCVAYLAHLAAQDCPSRLARLQCNKASSMYRSCVPSCIDLVQFVRGTKGNQRTRLGSSNTSDAVQTVSPRLCSKADH